MAKLLSFGKSEAETTLFEHFAMLFKLGDFPDGEKNRLANKTKRVIHRQSVAGGSLKFAHCPTCTQRWIQHEGGRTLAGNSGADLIFEKEQWEYVVECLTRPNRIIFDELRDSHEILLDRMDEVKEKSFTEWQETIAQRDSPNA